jgi:RNA polymerase sigma-70 factor (ECF subfamily)
LGETEAVTPSALRNTIVPPSDTELVEAACGGDVDSFRQLYERYYGMAVGIARSRLSDAHLAEDAAQEAFATACRELASLRDAGRFPEWLGTICRRTASRMSRSQLNGKPLGHEPITLPEANNAADATKVHRALSQLSSSAREVIQLHYFSGLAHEEIARILGTTSSAVHGRLQRARRTLAKLLANREG